MKDLVWLFFLGLFLCSCEQSRELKPKIEAALPSFQEGLYFSYDAEYICAISDRELFFSKNGWVAYKNDKSRSSHMIYVYKRPKDMKDQRIIPVVATNEMMLADYLKGTSP